MASLLRQIIASPRARHPEAGLDLCYVTDFIIATSGPSQTYPQLAYRNPLDQLVAFLDAKHGKDWAIWEFRAEGTGYPDEAVYNRIWHYPWPDHHPPPFRLIPMIMASMRNWLHGGDPQNAHKEQDKTGQDMTEQGKTEQSETEQPSSSSTPATGSNTEAAATTPAKSQRNPNRVVVVHCKAGKGRSGTASCSYLIAEEGWKAEDALARFTQRRMRPQFGAGVSIPSQLRYVGYVDRWTKGGKKYVDRPVEIVEIHVWGLRNGVKMDVEAFADEGKRIESLHTFTKDERVVVEGDAPEGGGLSEIIWDLAGYSTQREKAPEAAEFADAANNEVKKKDSFDPTPSPRPSESSMESLIRRKSAKLIGKVSPPGSHSKVDKLRAMLSVEPPAPTPTTGPPEVRTEAPDETEPGGKAVIFKPKQPVRVPNSDVNISVERRNRTHKSMGLTMVTAVAYVWFNAFFEGNGPEQQGIADSHGTFEIEWDAMDGVKGSSRKGMRAFDRMTVVWRFPDSGEPTAGEQIVEPKEGEPVPQSKAADWKGTHSPKSAAAEKDLGLRQQSPMSVDISRASSIKSAEGVASQGQGQGQNEGVNADEVSKGLKRSGPSGEDFDQGEEKTA
ncbi:phosphatases II [Trichoderma citrinoviride]|uniref:phosphatidylinositol-3,4,5-trisphosphate 3-phosphatase n=1 Tax=Trichoderma citrinoviride TaxID=58853 RepID=A0A2T4B6B9_9HYPO|nr:phosphatases II [Trichoderma citrinoviride]PTB64872.1 phosphatases II [Trichoderma citrinoviride]